MVSSLDERAAAFDQRRAHLRAVAYHLTGSPADAEDAVQEAWLRLARTDPDEIGNLTGWLTTVVARLCLDILRTRTARGESPAGDRLPDPVVSGPDGVDPEQEALLAESVGLAMLVVLGTLSAAERTAFVLHDVFAVPFDGIARFAGRSTDAVKQLASRGRRRVRAGVPTPDPDPVRRRAVADAFFAAAREGDFDALPAVLDPDVVVRADLGPARALQVLRGARTVAREAARFARLAEEVRPVLVNGGPGRVAVRGGAPFAVLGLTVAAGRVVALDVLADPGRLRALGFPDTARRRLRASPGSLVLLEVPPRGLVVALEKLRGCPAARLEQVLGRKSHRPRRSLDAAASRTRSASSEPVMSAPFEHRRYAG